MLKKRSMSYRLLFIQYLFNNYSRLTQYLFNTYLILIFIIYFKQLQNAYINNYFNILQYAYIIHCLFVNQIFYILIKSKFLKYVFKNQNLSFNQQIDQVIFKENKFDQIQINQVRLKAIYQEMLNFQINSRQLQQLVQVNTILDDEKVMPHISKILSLLTIQTPQDLNLTQLSNIIKQTQLKITPKPIQINNDQKIFKSVQKQSSKKCNYQVKNFIKDSEKLKLVGISLGQLVTQRIYYELIRLIEDKSITDARFWGKIFGTQRDYYVVQGYKPAPKQHSQLSLGTQKTGQGVNYYTYYVTNDIFSPVWQQLPSVTIQQVRESRKIKHLFSGLSSSSILSYPIFPGLQRHYLKCQLVRITHSLQLSPKGVYKVHDQNPKLIQYQDEVKIPEFTQLSTLESWQHKNQMILNLGRCTHFVDPSLTQEQIQATTAELAQKDPEIQRLRSITQDKPAEIVQGGLQSYWIQKIVGNTQVFPKDDAQNVYAVVTLKNIFWPGWITIGYNNGYCNFYLGNGLKSSQASWNNFTNQNLQIQGQETTQFAQPNPKQLPKVQQIPIQAQQNQQQANEQ